MIHRKLRLEPLEDRRVLASVVVTNNLDTIDGDTSSLTALQAAPGDDGISIREAIEAANNTPGADEITFDFGHDGPEVILLTEGELLITDSLTITGDGPELLTIDAGNGTDAVFNTGDGHRLFLIDDHQEETLIEVTLSDMTLTGGDVEPDTRIEEFSGGAVVNWEQLTLANMVVQGNAASEGGGVFNFDGMLTILQSALSGNAARRGSAVSTYYGGKVHIADTTVSANLIGRGLFNRSELSIERSTISDHLEGGIFSDVDSVLSVAGSTIRGNSASNGAGIDSRGITTITRSSIVDNRADSKGGGISSGSHEAMLTIVDSTISGNAAQSGGGLYNGGTAHIHHTTISSNSANVLGSQNGGGIHNGSDSTLLVTHSTITNNWANSGGGINTGAALKVEIHHSIVAGNVSNFGDFYLVATGSYNLIGIGSPLQGIENGVDGNMVGTVENPINPHLGPLADHGGPTMTHALLPSSPAIDAGDPSLAYDPLEYDQRGEGFARVANGGNGLRIDMGAYESQGVPDYPVGDYNHDGIASLADHVLWRNTLGSTANLDADGNHNSEVDAADYTVWREHFGNTTIPLTPVETPTDAAFALFVSPDTEDPAGDPATMQSSGSGEASADNLLLLWRATSEDDPQSPAAAWKVGDDSEDDGRDDPKDSAVLDQSLDALPILR